MWDWDKWDWLVTNTIAYFAGGLAAMAVLWAILRVFLWVTVDVPVWYQRRREVWAKEWEE